MKILTIQQLKKLYPNAINSVLIILSHKDTFTSFGINTDLRYRHFMAQMAHESWGFSKLREVTTPQKAKRKYGVGTKVGQMLGNVVPGDGAKYIGRGLVQLTGRWNYWRQSKLLKVDILKNPELLENPLLGTRVAFTFWNSKGLTKWADSDNINKVTKKLNGGYNGLQDRIREYSRISKMLNK
jgi:putative chitinase